MRRFSAGEMERFRIHIAKEKAKISDLDGAIEIVRDVIDFLFNSGEMVCRGPATMVLVESLLRRGLEEQLTIFNLPFQKPSLEFFAP